MKPSLWNVLKLGVGGVLSASFLVACADGRGSNGFRSYQYTKEEMAANKAIADAKAGRNSNIPVNNNPVVDSNAQNGGNGNNNGQGATGTGGAGATGNNQQQGALPQDALDTLEYQKAQDAAQSKVLADNQQEALQVSVDQLRNSNELALKKDFKALKQLKDLVKGVTVTSNMADKQLLLNIDALVLIDGVDHTVSVQNSPIKFLKDGVTTALAFRLKKGTELVIPGKKLVITALCKDEHCAGIRIRFMFENRAGIVVGYQQDDQGQWRLVESNIGEVPDLNGAQNLGQGNDLEKKAREAAEAAERGQNLSEEQKNALAVQRAQEEAQARLAQEAQAKQAEEAAKLAAAEKKNSEDAATLAAGLRLEQGYEEAGKTLQSAEATPQEKQNSEEAAALALGFQFEGAFDRAAEAKQLPWQQKSPPAAGASTDEADPFFTPQ